MVRIRCETARFTTAGQLRCVRCGARSLLSPETWVTMLILPMRIIAWDAHTGVKLHECNDEDFIPLSQREQLQERPGWITPNPLV